MPVLTGCHKPQSTDVIGAAEASIKTTAIARIVAKHPDVSSSDLKFSYLNIIASPNGKEEVFANFELPSSAKTNTEGGRATTTTLIFGVRMSPSGEIEDVYQSTNYMTQ